MGRYHQEGVGQGVDALRIGLSGIMMTNTSSCVVGSKLDLHEDICGLKTFHEHSTSRIADGFMSDHGILFIDIRSTMGRLQANGYVWLDVQVGVG